MKTGRTILLAALAGLCAAPVAAAQLKLFKAPVLVRAIGFDARYVGDRVITTWKKYLRADFKAYKVVRSSTMTDPVFPENGELFSTDKREVTRFDDNKVDDGIWYYRLCVITKQNRRWVSPVVEILAVRDLGPEGVPAAKDFE